MRKEAERVGDLTGISIRIFNCYEESELIRICYTMLQVSIAITSPSMFVPLLSSPCTDTNGE
jgi:hypothetical protein